MRRVTPITRDFGAASAPDVWDAPGLGWSGTPLLKGLCNGMQLKGTCSD